MILKKALVYTRVSDQGQLSGLSLEVQQDLCVKWARENGYSVVGVYTDAAKSGTKTVGREALDDMIIKCQDKREHIDAILVIDTDRIARNEIDHFFIKNELRKSKTQLIAINQPMINDSAEGQFFETILAGTNAFYSRLTGRKVKKTLEKKCNDGWRPSWAPIGYINVNRGSEEHPQREIDVDPEQGKHITNLFRLFSTGKYNIDQLRDMLYEDGFRSKFGNKVARSTMYNIIKNPLYIGLFRYNDTIYQGKHPHLTTPEIFEVCQKIIETNNHNACRRRKYKWLLTGIAYCDDCGSRMYCSYNLKKKMAYYHGAYRKGCREYVPLDDLEKQVGKEIAKIKFSDDFKQRIYEKAKDLINLSSEKKDEEIHALQNKVKALEIKRNLLEDNLLDQTIDKETFKRKHSEINVEIQSLENQMANIENQRGFELEVVREVLNIDEDLYTRYRKAKFEAKQYYLSIFFSKVMVYDKQIKQVEYQPLFQKLIEANKVTLSSDLLPQPWTNITIDFEAIICAFQDVRYIGELRQRWNEIKKLQVTPALAIA